MNSKKYIKLLMIILVLFLCFHQFIWQFYVSKIHGRDDGLYIGDCGRISMQIDSLYPRKLEYTLEKKHISQESWNEQNIDIVTVGDSFSNADTGGKNPYYQDYISDKYNLNVLNLKRNDPNVNSFELIIYLYNSGWLKKHKPKAVLIQSVQRSTLDRFAREFDFKLNKLKMPYIAEKLKKTNTYIPKLKSINTSNYKFLKYSFKYLNKDNGHHDIYKVKLNKNLFSNTSFENQLLFFIEDLQTLSDDQKRYLLLNDNFNKLALMLKNINVDLIFMPAVNKYDLYSQYIINNTYPIDNFFENFRKLPKEYKFIDTKKILSKSLKNGIKDIYYADDTHWSYKASEEIVNDKEVFKILKNYTKE